ncbi:transglycosylase SLT domain-containing protein [Curvibacter sp. APW13]|uniref:transglycosylase SLT domain-containing protein n=1 Tax=Curvibacter sp. APW13 TaxID=3077236 RepID=UPI0028DF08D4|nr:transglycosylase SLT domain-containing protein [Curvibacter sp. APW13]MDT8992225.1 transglycosylase SLT domain-containing protein [Curvibacter sp. APW13]
MKPFLLLTLVGALLLGGCASAPPAGNANAPVHPASTSVSTSPAPSREPAPVVDAGPSARPSGESLRLQQSNALSLFGLGTSAPTPAAADGGDFSLPKITLGGESSRTVVSLSAPVDLWERIRRGFAMPDLQSSLVADREQWYTARPDYIFRMTERSRKYLFHIVEELELRDMPTELALLPFVESAFNPQAVSTAKAAGMWQFMPATGRTFDLKQNVFRDDRRDVLASTRAALDYLQKLYRMFGDWHLALAAYNWGEGSVQRAIRKSQNAGGGTGYTEINMPMETRFYVPKLQAMKNIVANPAQFNSRLPDIPNHPFFDTVTIRRDIDVALAARLAHVSVEDFKALNPSMHKPVILAAGTPQILLPWDNAALFQTNLESFAGRLASWTVWIAPSNMNAAEAAKRVGMSEAELRTVNGIPARMLIRGGSTLLVPRGAGIQHDVAEKVADNGQISLAPEVTLRKTSVKAAKGDTVASLARKHKVSAQNIAQWNNVSTSASFKPGQSVVLYVAARPGKGSAATAKAKGSAKAVKGKSVAKGKSAAPQKRKK